MYRGIAAASSDEAYQVRQLKKVIEDITSGYIPYDEEKHKASQCPSCLRPDKAESIRAKVIYKLIQGRKRWLRKPIITHLQVTCDRCDAVVKMLPPENCRGG